MADAIGSLFIDLSMQTASFDAATKRVETQVRGLTSKIQAGFGALKGVIASAGLVVAAQQIGQWSQAMAKAGEDASNLAATLGLTLRQVVEFQGVFALTSGSLEDARAAMQRFNVTVSEARAGASDAVEKFENVGVSMRDLAQAGDDPAKVLRLLADRWIAYADSGEKSARFTELFGRNVASIIPALRGGSAGIDALIKRFDELNPKAEEAIKKGNDLDSKLDELGVSVKGLANEAFSILSPAISNATDGMISFTSSIRGAIAAANESLAPIGGLANTLSQLGRLPLIAGRVMQGVISGDPEAAIRALELPQSGPVTTIKLPPVSVTAEQLPKKKSGGGGGKKGGGGGGRGKDDALDEWKEAVKLMEDMAEEARDAALAMTEGMQDISDELFDRRVKQIRNQLDLEKITGQEAIDLERQVANEKWEANKEFYRQKREAAEGDKKKLADLDRQEKLDHERHLTELGQLDHDKVKLRFDDFKDAARDLGSVLENTFSNAFDGITEGTFKLRTALGGLLKDMGRMIANKAFQMLLNGGSSSSSGGGLLGSLFGAVFSGFGGGGVSTAATGGLGYPGLAEGGSFRVSGSGGIDSQLIAARMTPGELVEVTPPGQAGGMGGGPEVIRLEVDNAFIAGIADQQITTRSGTIIQVAEARAVRSVQRNWSGMSSEASQRQL